MRRKPLGPNGSYKTGQRVPFSGFWKDQYGSVIQIDAGATFPPCLDRQGECAYRHQMVDIRLVLGDD